MIKELFFLPLRPFNQFSDEKHGDQIECKQRATTRYETAEIGVFDTFSIDFATRLQNKTKTESLSSVTLIQTELIYACQF